MLVRMALLSSLRRPKRAALIVMAVALSVFVMEFVSGWVEGMRERMNTRIVQDSAHLIVERSARLESLDPLEPVRYMPDSAAIAARLAADPRVARVEALSPFWALVVVGQKNLPLRLDGIEGDTRFFSRVAKGVVRGSFPFAGAGVAISARALSLIGAPDAESVVVLVEDAFGAPAYRELQVACVFQTDDSDFDVSTGLIDGGSASDLLGTVGSAELWLRLRDPDDAEALKADLLPYLSSREYTARTWSELQGDLLVIIKLMDVFMLVINVIVLVVAATVITNAILMNVFEKQREYGTLRAIGMRRREQAFLVLMEGAALGVVGAVVGAFLVFPVLLYLEAHGLRIGEASHMFGSGDVMFFSVNLVSTIRDIAFGVMITVVGSLYAAFAGTRSTVVEALRSA
jgi:putative ABC transport system permease protein